MEAREPPRIPRDEYRPEYAVIWGFGAIIFWLIVAAWIWLR